MHNAGFQALGLPFSYVGFQTADTDKSIQAVRTLGIRGLSITIPHKERAKELVDIVDPVAAEIGAINTLINDGEKLSGHNTDWIGIREAFSEAGVSLSGANVVVCGAGGASRAAVYCAKQAGAGVITVVNRNSKRAKICAADFGVKAVTLSELPNLLKSADIILNGTPAGPDELGIDCAKLQQKSCVFDFAVKPSPLVAQAKQRGCTVILGSRMLFHQAVEQFRLFTERNDVPVKAMEQALVAELAR